MTVFSRLLVDSADIYKTARDPDTAKVGKLVSSKMTISKCRIDRNHTYTFSGNAQVLMFDMTIFVYPKYAGGMVIGSDYEGGIATIDGTDYTIISIATNKMPTRNVVMSYEIGVKKAGH